MQITFEGDTIEVKEYLPISQKYNFIVSTVQGATETNGMVSDLKLDLFFNLNLLFFYTDIKFEENEESTVLYDRVSQNGLLDAVIKAIPDKEYATLFDYVSAEVENQEKYACSLTGIVDAIFKDLPGAISQLNDNLKDLDTEKYTNVVNFAKANGMTFNKK